MKTFLKIILCLMAFNSLTFAQSFTQKGTIELGGDITYTSLTQTQTYLDYTYGFPTQQTISFTESIFAFNPYFGEMLAKGFEFGIRPGFSISSPGSNINYDIYLAPAYNIDSKRNAYAYFEFLAGYSAQNKGGLTSGGLGIGGDFGVKLAIKESSLFLFKLEYLHRSLDETYSYPYSHNSPSVSQYSSGTFSFGVGFRMFISHSATTNK